MQIDFHKNFLSVKNVVVVIIKENKKSKTKKLLYSMTAHTPKSKKSVKIKKKSN